MLDGFLPIGSVVLLKNSSKRVMIIGILQQQVREDGEKVIWDYSGCYYPEGYMGPDKCFLFNTEQIDRIFALGYQDAEQFSFKEKADSMLKELRERDQQ